MSEAIPYASPLDVQSPDECFWYHTMNLPGHGVIEGAWDFRGQDELFFSNTDFTGKRVLEIGPATGALGFRMEELGAEVTSAELPSGNNWDVVPLAAANPAKIFAGRETNMRRVKRSYWLSHKALGSKNKVISCSAYDTPHESGPYDIAYFASVLTHMQNPFQALQHNLDMTTERVIIVEQHHPDWTPQTPGADITFQPDCQNPDFYDTWWTFTPTALVKMVGVLGFEKVVLIMHQQLCGETPVPLATVIADRTRPPFKAIREE